MCLSLTSQRGTTVPGDAPRSWPATGCPTTTLPSVAVIFAGRTIGVQQQTSPSCCFKATIHRQPNTTSRKFPRLCIISKTNTSASLSSSFEWKYKMFTTKSSIWTSNDQAGNGHEQQQSHPLGTVLRCLCLISKNMPTGAVRTPGSSKILKKRRIANDRLLHVTMNMLVMTEIETHTTKGYVPRPHKNQSCCRPVTMTILHKM